MIYISTGGFDKLDGFRASIDLIDSGCEHIELSSGRYSGSLLADLRTLKGSTRFKIHNYFPPPELPIVLNLASLEDAVANASIEHVKKAIRWAIELGEDTYSFHAGFLLDPKVEELGKRVQPRSLYDRRKSLSIFIARLNDLDDYAQRYGVRLLIENNVLSANNYKSFQSNPFLMVDADECIYVMNRTSDNVRLLVDVAHLKVSANSVGFDPVEFLKSCSDWVGAYHLSDNDGLRDSNEPIRNDSWFWPHIRRDLDYYSVEVYGVSTRELISQRDLVHMQLANGNYEEA